MAPASYRRGTLCLLASFALAVVAVPAGAAQSAAEAAAAAEAASVASAKRLVERADYQLLFRYPDLATYLKLKAEEVDVVKGHLHQAGLRLGELLAKRRGLNAKAEFYKGKRLPPDLQAQMDESDASLTASMYVFRGLEQDIARIVAKYEHPREHLEKLWAGAPLGSIGLYDPAAPASAAK